MTRRTLPYVALAIVVVLLAAGGGLWLSRADNAPAQATSVGDLQTLAAAGAGWDQASASGTGLPGTASKLDIRAWFPGPVTAAGTRTLNVRLHIREGWHVNANPPSLDFLIPTTVQATAGGRPLKLNTTYPPGVHSNVRLDKTPVTVYENATTIRSELPANAVAAATAAGKLNVAVRAQACNDKGVCLPPSTLATEVPVADK